MITGGTRKRSWGGERGGRERETRGGSGKEREKGLICPSSPHLSSTCYYFCFNSTGRDTKCPSNLQGRNKPPVAKPPPHWGKGHHSTPSPLNQALCWAQYSPCPAPYGQAAHGYERCGQIPKESLSTGRTSSW